MNQPSLTVLMPVYNAAPFVGEAIQSILGQSYKNFEFLIVNNGSTDHSREIIDSFKDPRIRVMDLPVNEGPPPALNKGLKEIRSKYVARMDADDISLPDRLERQIRFMEENPEYAVVGTQRKTIDHKGRISYTPPLPTKERDIVWKLLFNSPLIHSSVVMRRDIVEQTGGYNEKFRYGSDFDLWSQLLRRKHKISNLNKVLLLNRHHAGQDGVHAGVQSLLHEAAEICAENIRYFAGLPVKKEEVVNLLRLLDWQDRCPADRVSEALSLLDKVAKNFSGRPNYFYGRTLFRLGLLGQEVDILKRAFLLLKGLFSMLPCHRNGRGVF